MEQNNNKLNYRKLIYQEVKTIVIQKKNKNFQFPDI